MLHFLPYRNNSVTIGLNFLLASVSTIMSSNTINTFLCLLNFHRHHQLFVNNQLMPVDFLNF